MLKTFFSRFGYTLLKNNNFLMKGNYWGEMRRFQKCMHHVGQESHPEA